MVQLYGVGLRFDGDRVTMQTRERSRDSLLPYCNIVRLSSRLLVRNRLIAHILALFAFKSLFIERLWLLKARIMPIGASAFDTKSKPQR